MLDNAHPFVPTALTELDYTYYANGSVHTVNDSSNVSSLSANTATTTYVYNPLSQVAIISQSGTGASSKEAVFGYYGNGQTHTVETAASDLEVALGTYSYDADARITALSYAKIGGAVTTTGGSDVSYGLEHDAAGNIKQVTSADGTDNYGLDNSDQLTIRHRYRPGQRKLFLRPERQPHEQRLPDRGR